MAEKRREDTMKHKTRPYLHHTLHLNVYTLNNEQCLTSYYTQGMAIKRGNIPKDTTDPVSGALYGNKIFHDQEMVIWSRMPLIISTTQDIQDVWPASTFPKTTSTVTRLMAIPFQKGVILIKEIHSPTCYTTYVVYKSNYSWFFQPAAWWANKLRWSKQLAIVRFMTMSRLQIHEGLERKKDWQTVHSSDS